MKINVTLDVPDGDECGWCDYRYRDVCMLFDEWISAKDDKGLRYGKKLPQCVKDSALVEPYGWVVEVGGIFDMLHQDKDVAEQWRERLDLRYDDVQLFPVIKMSEQGAE